MPVTVLRNTLILLTISLYIAVSVQNDDIEAIEEQDEMDVAQLTNENIEMLLRTKREVKKSGFFRTLFSVIGEQYTDTKESINNITKLAGDLVAPENTPVTEVTTSSDPNATTTAAPYRLTGSELTRILRRNVKGLNRLFNIELRDALRQSKISKKEYDRNLSKEISKFL